jgi:hypothetical protein
MQYLSAKFFDETPDQKPDGLRAFHRELLNEFWHLRRTWNEYRQLFGMSETDSSA